MVWSVVASEGRLKALRQGAGSRAVRLARPCAAHDSCLRGSTAQSDSAPLRELTRQGADGERGGRRRVGHSHSVPAQFQICRVALIDNYHLADTLTLSFGPSNRFSHQHCSLLQSRSRFSSRCNGSAGKASEVRFFLSFLILCFPCLVLTFMPLRFPHDKPTYSHPAINS